MFKVSSVSLVIKTIIRKQSLGEHLVQFNSFRVGLYLEIYNFSLTFSSFRIGQSLEKVSEKSSTAAVNPTADSSINEQKLSLLLICIREFTKPRRQRQRKRHLEINFRVTCTTSRLLQFV